MDNSLEIYSGREIIYTNTGHWLYPLFDLEIFLEEENLNIDGLILKDKIAGRAAASIISYLGFKKVHIGLLSKLGLDVFNKYNVEITWDKLIDRVKCKTESILEGIDSIEEVYTILKKRAGLFHGLEINCRELTCGYSNIPVLENISLTLNEGDTLILRGDNGSGKTTLLKSIGKLLPIINGQIVFKKNSEEYSLHKGEIGYLDQSRNSKNMPILVKEIMESTADVLGLKGEDKQYQIDISLRRTGAIDLKDKLYYELSGGERQRVNLARLICQKARVFLLDEPTTFLDSNGIETLTNLLKDIHKRERPTIIIASHDREFIKSLGWGTVFIQNKEIQY